MKTHLRWMTVLAASAALVLVGVGAASPVHSPQAADTAQGRWVMRALRIGSSSEAIAINERGQVICDSWEGGYGLIGDYTPAVYTAVLWENGTRIKLTLGGTQSRAADINERGQVVGWAYIETGDQHAFLWENGNTRDLGTLGGKASEAVAINESGQVVGSSLKSGRKHAFLWENGTMRDLGTLGGETSEAIAINNRGQVLVSADTIFLWHKGKRTRIGTPKDRIAPVAINGRGQVVGTMSTKAKGVPHARAFLWQNGKLRDLGTLGGPESGAVDINENGQVVGVAETKAKDEFGLGVHDRHAFLWKHGKMRDLGTLPGETDSGASAINERGQIAGDSGFGGTAFTWQKGKTTRLPTPRTLEGFAVALNDGGQVVGHTESRDCQNGCPSAVLWTFKP